MTYRQSFNTQEEAIDFCDTIINGGIIQLQEGLWHVWQLNSSNYNMEDPKKETIALLTRAIGDGNIPVHFKHKNTHYKPKEGIVQYTFAINGVDFKTGWHDQVDCDFLEGIDYDLVSTHDINLALWYVSQGDTVYFDLEQQRRDAPSDIDKALDHFLGPCPF